MIVASQGLKTAGSEAAFHARPCFPNPLYSTPSVVVAASRLSFVDGEATATRHHVFHFVECLEKTHLTAAYCSASFRARPCVEPRPAARPLDKNAHGERRLAVGRDVENVLSGGRTLAALLMPGVFRRSNIGRRILVRRCTSSCDGWSLHPHWSRSCADSLAKDDGLAQRPRLLLLFPGETTRPYSEARANRSNMR